MYFGNHIKVPKNLSIKEPVLVGSLGNPLKNPIAKHKKENRYYCGLYHIFISFNTVPFCWRIIIFFGITNFAMWVNIFE